MLDELHVRNYALVRDAVLSFASGCTVLSGETGAGKTALIGALKLLIGERSDVAAISAGAGELLVEGRVFDGDTEHVASRRLSREGRSRCSLDDGMATVGALAERLGPLFDLHGQHEHQSLLSLPVQLDYLDRFAGQDGQKKLADYQRAWDNCQELRRLLDELRQAAQGSRQSLAEAEFTLREIDGVGPQAGEYQGLERDLPILRNGEALAMATQAALDALRGQDGSPGALDALATAHQALSRQAGTDPRLDELAALMEAAAITVDDLAGMLRSYRDSVQFDADALQAALDRLGELEGLRRRFGPRMEDVFAAYDAATRQLELTENVDERIEAATAQLSEAEQSLKDSAAALEEMRAQAAESLSTAINNALAELAMPSSAVGFSTTPLAFEHWTRAGSLRYELSYRPSSQSVARPLAKIASGGELSRVMLALKTLQKDGSDAMTLVFDEVDAGIGGATANAVAAYIRRLGQKQQVVVVTHLAQIAAIADRHFVVEKSQQDGSVYTDIREVDGEERVAEIARMLSGSTDAVALEHARQLLADSGDAGGTGAAAGSAADARAGGKDADGTGGNSNAGCDAGGADDASPADDARAYGGTA
jgi:DNA repair protein RecN (Recombination protein N)